MKQMAGGRSASEIARSCTNTYQSISNSYKVQLTKAYVKLRRFNPLPMSLGLAFKVQTWRPGERAISNVASATRCNCFQEPR